MIHLLNAAARCVDQRLWMPALVCYLTLPDACAAVETPGKANKIRYPEWFDANVDVALAGVNGALAWALRNAVMHTIRTDWTAFGVNQVVIKLPTPMMVHQVAMMNVGEREGGTLIVEFNLLCRAIHEAVAKWWTEAQMDDEKKDRLDGLMQLRPAGNQLMQGFPIIC